MAEAGKQKKVQNSLRKNLREKWCARNSSNQLRRKLKEMFKVGQGVP